MVYNGGQMRQTRYQIVMEKPKLWKDLTIPRYAFRFPYRTAFLIIVLLRMLRGLIHLYRWDSYNYHKREQVKDEVFYYFWLRKYPKKK